MNATMLASLIRYIIVAIGGYLGLSADGKDKWIDELTGAIMVAIPILFSLYPKWKEHRKNNATTNNDMIKPTLQSIALTLMTVYSLFLTGCKTTDGTTWLTPTRVENLAALTFFSGVSADLISNPGHRPQFALASEKLTQFISVDKWDATAALACLQSVPISELQTAEARIAFQAGLILIDLAGVGEFDARNQAHVKALLVGASRGLSLALSFTPEKAERSIPSTTIYWKLKQEELKTRIK